MENQPWPLLPQRESHPISDWPNSLNASDFLPVRNLLEDCWPLDGLDRFHTLMPVDHCIHGDPETTYPGVELLHQIGLVPVASSQLDYLAVDGTSDLHVYFASGSEIISALVDHDELPDNQTLIDEILCRTPYNLREYLRRLELLEQSVRDGSYQPDEKCELPFDFDDAAKEFRQ